MTNNRLNIGIFTCHIDNDYAKELCKGAEYAAKELDMNLIVFPGMFLNASFYDPANQMYDYQYNSIFYYANPECLDALIISAASIQSFLSEKDLSTFLSHFDGIPILTIEEEIMGYPCIKTDNTRGMRQLMEHLVKEHDRKHICFVAGKEDNPESNQRLSIYRKVLAENGLPFNNSMIVHGDFSEHCKQEVSRLIDNNPDVDAIVFGNDQMAIGSYDVIKARGFKIGDNLSVTGFDDSPSSVSLDPPLTTVNANASELGYRAVHAGARLARSGSVSSESLEPQFIRRNSCCCGLCTKEDISNIYAILKSHSVSDIIEIIDSLLFADIENSFFSRSVIDAFNPIFTDIITYLRDDNQRAVSQDMIIDEIKEILSSSIVTFYPIQKAAYMFRKLSSIISGCDVPQEISIRFNQLNANIMNTISLFISNQLYDRMRKNQMTSWSSVYITRDTLTYGNDPEKTYMSILTKLSELDYEGAYIYTYDDSIKLNDNGSWTVPKSLFLQAYYNKVNKNVLFGETRRLPAEEIFDNEYTYYDKRFTSIIVPIFTNEDHHGLFICNTDVNNFGSIYSTSLQLGASLKYMSLLREQNITQEQLKMSLNEIHEKNELLNHLSTSDELTGIYNRRGFMERVEFYINIPSNLGKHAFLLFADMDSLKVVNDRFGHKDGDFALRNIANILSQSFGSNGVIGRIGGDEFVCFDIVDSPDYISQVQQRIKDYSAELNSTCGKPYFIEMSVGINEFICNGEQKIEDLLSQADTALYANKRYKRASILK